MTRRRFVKLPTNAFFQANRELWDAWTGIHEKSRFYDLEGFRNGRNTLTSIEATEVGDISGKSLLHLQCHFGLDTLSWARLGARVTGVDFSTRSIALAQSLAAELGISAHFLCADIYELPEVLQEDFDIVFTSYGVLDWLPDLGTWARIVADYVKPGGTFYLAEFHPVLNTLSEDGRRIQHRYFREQPIRTRELGSYADPEADFSGESLTWCHSLGEVVSAVASAGLQIDFLHEFPYSPYDCFPFTEEVEAGRSMIRGRHDTLPLLFTLRATKN